MPTSPHYLPAPRFDRLDSGFYDVVAPARFPRHTLRLRHQPRAARIGLGDLTPHEWERHLARFEPLPHNLTAPLALRYNGHQFGAWNPDLGDGRGFLYAQLRDPLDGRLLDLGTKGSGQTPWSRGGDGRLTLKGGVREALATELLHALGVNTSHTLSIFETGESLHRGDEPSPTRSCVLVRLSHGHVRFGTFQRLAYRGDAPRLRALLRYCADHLLAELADTPEHDLPAAFLDAVTARTARLAAQWMAAGFVHGVLNTDNMNVTGESFDYGPWRFLPRLDPAFTAAYFDHSGLYAYGRQPDVCLWNLQRLADALDPITPREPLYDRLEAFHHLYHNAHTRALLDRLGVLPRDPHEDRRLTDALLDFLNERTVSWAQLFHDLYGGLSASRDRLLRSPEADGYEGARFARLRQLLRPYAPAHDARLTDPFFALPRPPTLLIEEVEALWEPIARADDWSAFDQKIAQLRAMARLFDRDPDAP